MKKFLSETQVEELLSKHEAKECKEYLKQITELDSSIKSDILIDFYYNNLLFSIDNNFSNEKISTFLSIMKHLHSTSMQQNLSLYDSYNLFKKLIVDHSVHRPPFSVEIFNVQDVHAINDYVYESYFKHYKLYTYVFCKKQEANIKPRLIEDEIEKPFSKPLKDFIPLEEWNKQIEEKKKEEEQKQQEIKNEPEEVPTEVTDAKTDEIESKKEDKVQIPEINPFVKKQVEPVMQLLQGMINEKFSQIDTRLKGLEESINVNKQNRPPSAKKSKKK